MFYESYKANESVGVYLFGKEKFTEEKSEQSPQKVYFLIFQSKMICKKKPALFLTSVAECGKMTLVAKCIFIC